MGQAKCVHHKSQIKTPKLTQFGSNKKKQKKRGVIIFKVPQELQLERLSVRSFEILKFVGLL